MNIRKIINSPYFLLPVLLFMWASLAAASKIVLQEIDTFLFLFYANLFALITFVALVAANKETHAYFSKLKKDIPMLCLCGVFAYLYYFFYYSALSIISATEASIINYTFPILIVVFDTLINRNRMSFFTILSLAIGLFGTIFILTGGNIFTFRLTNPAGAVYAFSAACSWALFSVLGRRPKGHLLLNNAVYMAVSFIISLITVIIFSGFTAPSLTTILLVLWLGSCVFALGTFIWFKLFELISVSLMANLVYVTPFATLLFIAVFLNENITIFHIIGLVIILSGVAVQKLDKRKQRK